MRSRHIFWVVLLCAAYQLSGQNPAVVDSLERVAARAPNDSARVEAYSHLCNYFSPFDNEKRGEYARKMLDLSERKNPDGSVETRLPVGRARALYQMGSYHYQRSEYAEALAHFYECLTLNEQLDRKSGIAACLSSIAKIHVALQQWPEAEAKYLQSKAVYESIDFTRGVRSVLINFGAMLGLQGRDAEALDYYLQAEKTYTDPNDRAALATVYSNIGLCYKNTGQPAQARAYYEKAAQEYARTGEHENLELLQLNIGDLYLDEGRMPEALDFYNAALHSAQSNDRKAHVARAYNQLVILYLRLGETAGTSTQKDSLYGLAFQNNQNARLYADSVLNATRGEQLAELRVRYETEKQEREISQLGAEAKAREIELLKQEVELRQRRLEAERAREQAVLLEKNNANIALELEVNAANLRGQNAENQRKQQEIELLNKENALREAEARRERAVSMGLKIGLTLFGLLLCVLWWLFGQKNRANRAMLLQNREIMRQRKEIEAQNRQLEEASHYKSIFLSNMSHEIRTPLNTVNNVSTLLADTPLNPRQRDYADAMRHASQNLLVLVNDILDLSKIEAGKIELRPAPFDLRVLLEKQIELLRYNTSELPVALSLQCADDVPHTIVGDAGRLGQALLNLLGNALKFTEKGSVTLSCAVRERPAADQVLLEFTVQDTGIGIPEDKLGHIFDAFAQAETDTHVRFGGTGLGLAITRQLVELQGGSIWVESVFGQGSTFRFTLPARVAEAEAAVVAPQIPERKLGACRVLLVEDNALNQLFARELMEKMVDRPDITVAANGAEAVEKALAQPFDLIFMDIRMPVMDGFAATAALRAAGLTTPVVALTANATSEEEQKCRAAGMDDYLSKPIDPAFLRKKFERWAYAH